MSQFARRHLIGSRGALDAAGAVPGVLAANPGAMGAMSKKLTRIEKKAQGSATAGTRGCGNDAAPHNEVKR